MDKASDFDPASGLGPCNCIKDLLIISHGMSSGVYEDGEVVIVEWGEDELVEDLDRRQISDKIVNLKFCKSCRIELRACELGNSKILRSRLESTGCDVVLYNGLVNAWGWEQ